MKLLCPPQTVHPGPGRGLIGRRFTWIALLVISLLYALAINNRWAVKPDSALYLTLGRSLAEGRGMEYNGQQVWGIPPGLPAMIAAARWITGGDGFWLLNSLLSAMAVAAAALAFGIVRRLAADRSEDERQFLAIAAMLLVGLSARMFGDATLILTDVPCTLLIALALYALLRGSTGSWTWYLLAGTALGLATWVRLLAPLLGLAMIVGLAMESRAEPRRILRRFLAAAAVGAILAVFLAAWLLAARTKSDSGTPDYLLGANQVANSFGGANRWHYIATALPRLPGAMTALLTDQKSPWLAPLPTFLILAGLAASIARRRWIVVLPVVVYLTFLVVWGSGAMAARYLLPLLPLVAYLLLVGAVATVDVAARRFRLDEKRAPGRRRAAVALVAGLCLAVSLPKDLRTIWWMRQPDFYAALDHGRWRGCVEASAYISSRSRPGDVAMTPEWTIMHYLTGLRTIGQLPDGDYVAENACRMDPAEFARIAAAGPARFLVVRTDWSGDTRPDWNQRTFQALAATGAFSGPPMVFDHLAVFERTRSP